MRVSTALLSMRSWTFADISTFLNASGYLKTRRFKVCFGGKKEVNFKENSDRMI